MSYAYDRFFNDLLLSLKAHLISLWKNLQSAAQIRFWHRDEDAQTLQQTKRRHAELWDESVGSMISQMMKLAGYSTPSQSLHRSFFSQKLAYSLGPYPTEKGRTNMWNSFMTDDHTPLELSWSWPARNSTPVVRYAAEPIGWFAGSLADPTNTKAGDECLKAALPWTSQMDLQWCRYFAQALMTTSEMTPVEKEPANNDSPSQTFIAFDLNEENMMVKYYFLPSSKATMTGKTNLRLAMESILSLQDLGHDLQKPLSVVIDYISSFPAEAQPHVLILAVDCVEASRSRVKIYVRFTQTSFDSMIDAMSLGGALPSFSATALQDLSDLWCSCFGVYCTSIPLKNIEHRTNGLLYYYELRNNEALPTSKVYLPVRHYAMDDDQVARGVSDFLWKRGMTLQNGISYYEGLSQLCKHRSLKDGLGFQTYITCAVKKGDISVNSYINPEVYYQVS